MVDALLVPSRVHHKILPKGCHRPWGRQRARSEELIFWPEMIFIVCAAALFMAVAVFGLDERMDDFVAKAYNLESYRKQKQSVGKDRGVSSSGRGRLDWPSCFPMAVVGAVVEVDIGGRYWRVSPTLQALLAQA